MLSKAVVDAVANDELVLVFCNFPFYVFDISCHSLEHLLMFGTLY